MARREKTIEAEVGSRISEAIASAKPAAVWVATDLLTPWAGNPKFRDAEAMRLIDNSLSRFGWGDVIVARLANGEIIAGHGRHQAALDKGEREVPVRFLDLSEQDAHDFCVALNRLAELSRWDDDKLLRHVQERLARDVAAVRAIGFSSADVERMLKTRTPPPKVERVATDDVADEFWINVRGPLDGQREVLDELRKRLGRVQGVTVHVGTVAKAG